ncbi:MAG: hypothetical protein R3E12_16590 [Candidatus Eisenbacteria bacterium]
MPHVELVGEIDLAAFHARFAPRSWNDEEAITKVDGCFLAHDGRSCLIECQVIEGYLRQAFLVLVTTRPSGLMVRLYPRTAPEKTHAVRRCLAWIARWLGEPLPRLELGSTNLEIELTEPWPPGPS